jgi:lipoyl-dependent peroxiredoxin
MKIKRMAVAAWSGGLRDGKGAITLESGAMTSYPYGFASRFEGVKGTNPEELLGAAHAGCFTMALSLALGQAGVTATQMETRALVTLEEVTDGYAITAIHLTLKAQVPDISQESFAELANVAKANCPLSKVLNTPITLEATLSQE